MLIKTNKPGRIHFKYERGFGAKTKHINTKKIPIKEAC